MASFCVGGVAQAGEGAGSHYVPGTRNDFLLGVFGPAGWYVRNDLWYFDYSMGVNPRGGVVTGEATEKAWLNTLKLSYLSNKEFFGARYGASMAATYVINADISGAATIGGGNALTGGDVSGLSDLYVAPVLLNWTGEKQHFTFQGAFYAPTGGYNPNAKLNTGRNYWTLDFVGNYTWFDPATGWEVSANAGYQYNFENPETNYKTGDETHVDWTFAKHFANKTALGLSGYYYAQVESDSGTLVGPKNASDFQAYSWGLGPSAQFNLPVGDKSVGIIAKALFDIDSKDRLEGDLFMLSATYAF
ncbi:transporter [Falsihalocynthiibacter sp. BN13B15]|uniref:SphA family protein n=1 Tax=Falsihalocynthiibacter sp. BN13B15 TaxID=3240871 RepID=UPI00351092C3